MKLFGLDCPACARRVGGFGTKLLWRWGRRVPCSHCGCILETRWCVAAMSGIYGALVFVVIPLALIGGLPLVAIAVVLTVIATEFTTLRLCQPRCKDR
jgi:hypothetical protein